MRQNPHVRICGGPGSATTLVYPTAVQVFKIHQPYHESDHVLNIAYNILCGGHTLDDIELRRTDRVFLDALGTDSLPDPTTAGDFCRRFDADRIEALMDALNETRLTVWQRCPGLTEQTARIDGDGTLVPTTGTCKEGMDIAYTGLWGYHPLVVSLANTGEPLFLKNRSGNRPSHEGVLPYFDKAIALCRRAGFTDILLRGDTDFALTRAFDRWTDAGVRFVFGYDATQTMVQWGETAPPALYTTLVRRANRALQTRARPARVKDRIVRERGFKNITTVSEAVVDFDYQPTACTRPYRVVALKKNLSVEKGEHVLFDDIRYFFYITNDTTLSCIEVVQEARQRCDQENLIAQLKGGVRALHAPVNTLHANWAYMVMASLAWSLKAWVALALPIVPRGRARHTEEQRRLLRMDFRTFLAAFVNVPGQIVTSGRRVIFRLLAWNPWQYVFFRFVAATSPAGTTKGRKEPHIHDHNPDASPVAAGPGGVRLACRGMCGTVASSLCDDLHGRAALVLGLGEVDVISREAYAGFDVDAKVEMIRALVPLGLMHVQELLEDEVTELAGARHARKEALVRGRRHGSNPGTVRLAGRRVPMRVPRVRSVAGGEIPLRSYEAAREDGQVHDVLLKRVLYGISCRNYEAAAESVPGAIGLSSSTVSRSFIQASAATLREFQERDLSGEDVVALFLDGKAFADSTMVVALGITMSGEKRFLGFVETDTENAKVLTPFLRSLVDRGLDASHGLLVILDGGKGLRSAVKKVFRDRVLVHRCQWHKRENVVSYLPKSEQGDWRRRLQRAYNRPTYPEALVALETLHGELDDQNQSAAGSLAEGLDETLTLHRLGVFAVLGRSFKTTNCLESVNALVEERCAKVDHWTNSSQRQRWLATALVDIEPRLRRVVGYRHLPKLRDALQRELKIDKNTSKTKAA